MGAPCNFRRPTCHRYTVTERQRSRLYAITTRYIALLVKMPAKAVSLRSERFLRLCATFPYPVPFASLVGQLWPGVFRVRTREGFSERYARARIMRQVRARAFL